MGDIPTLILSAGGIILMLFFVTYASGRHNLNSIKDKTGESDSRIRWKCPTGETGLFITRAKRIWKRRS